MSDLSKSWRDFAAKVKREIASPVARFDGDGDAAFEAALKTIVTCAEDVAQELEAKEAAEIQITINMEMARLIRSWRVDLGSTFRKVAERFGSLFPTHPHAKPTQKNGMILCAEAAILHKEDPSEGPWQCPMTFS